MLNTEDKSCDGFKHTDSLYNFVLLENVAKGNNVAVEGDDYQIDSCQEHVYVLQTIFEVLYVIFFIGVLFCVGSEDNSHDNHHEYDQFTHHLTIYISPLANHTMYASWQ